MRHFDVQLIGGMVLHQGKIAEMKTGEGKTLVATLAAYLNALPGKGVHVVTVNDYLARRDAAWMGEIYRFLGLAVGCIQAEMESAERQAQYAADVTYGQNNEFGFDYLRDNMKFSLEEYVQRDFCFAIVDEVDSILIDEARTPLIISGPSEQSTDKYYTADAVIPRLEKDKDFEIDEKAKTTTFTEEGVTRAEKLLHIGNLYEPDNIDVLHCLQNSLRAYHLFKRDRDYMVKDDEILIVDEFTGRVLPGRRWSDGLHQSVEAKEKVKIKSENQTFATITFQNYFRMYEKLAGMTGTAETEEGEFGSIYDLDVTVIPTNRPLLRTGLDDQIYLTEREKFAAIVEELADLYERGQPVLVGTISIENSEKLSDMLKKRGVPHEVLNAKHHEREAQIVAGAGQAKAITIATNMAGRGTDIVLGEGVTDLGGLHILGTERHESRRIDNQLRGRSGRQGDPGSSRFYLSLQDDLMRIFAGERVQSIMEKLGLQEGDAIEARMVSKAIERAQTQVEQHNFSIRKNLLEYDDVMNEQRKEIYAFRRELLEGGSQKEYVLRTGREMISWLAESHLPEDKDPEKWDFHGLLLQVRDYFGTGLTEEEINAETGTHQEIEEAVWAAALAEYEEKEERLTEPNMRLFEQLVLLRILDTQWKDHLLALDHLKEGIGLRGYAQKDPKVEYKRESFELFSAMKERIEEEVIRRVWLLEPLLDREEEEVEKQRAVQRNFVFGRGEDGGRRKPKIAQRRSEKKVGRNEPCPCGSGRKYKKCCGRAA